MAVADVTRHAPAQAVAAPNTKDNSLQNILAIGKDINDKLAAVGSPLAGQGTVFATQGYQYGINPYFLVAIAGQETSFGKYGPSQGIHNPFGLGPNLSFKDYPASIHYLAKLLGSAPQYKGKNTVAAIGATYSPPGAGNDPSGLNNNWVKGVSTFYQSYGFGPKASIRTGAVKGTDAGAPTPLDAAGAVKDAIVNPLEAVAGAIGTVFSMRGLLFILGSVAGIIALVTVTKGMVEAH